MAQNQWPQLPAKRLVAHTLATRKFLGETTKAAEKHGRLTLGSGGKTLQPEELATTINNSVAAACLMAQSDLHGGIDWKMAALHIQDLPDDEQLEVGRPIYAAKPFAAYLDENIKALDIDITVSSTSTGARGS